MVKTLPEIILSLEKDTTIPKGWGQSAIDIANMAIDRLNMDGKFPFLRTTISIGATNTRAELRNTTHASWLTELKTPKFYEPYWHDSTTNSIIKLNQNITYTVYSKWSDCRRGISHWPGVITDMREGFYKEYLDFILVSDDNASESGYDVFIDGYMMLSHFNQGLNAFQEDYGPTQYMKFGQSEILNYSEILEKAMALVITEKYSGAGVDIEDVPVQDTTVPPNAGNIALKRRQQDYFRMINHYINLANEREIEGAIWNPFPIETQIQDEYYRDGYD